MMAPYGSVTHALVCAFSSPREAYTRSSLFVASSGRGHNEMTAEEWITQNGMVQSIAVKHCHPAAVDCWRVQWDGDASMALASVHYLIDRFTRARRRRATIPDTMMVSVIQKWAGRKLVRVPVRPDRAWARLAGCDHKTVRAVRLALTESLAAADARGRDTLEPILVERGLLRPLDDSACG